MDYAIGSSTLRGSMTKRSRKWPRAVRDRLRSLLPSLAPARVKLARYGQAFLTVMNDHDGGAGDDLRQDDALPPSPLPPSANDERLAPRERRFRSWPPISSVNLLPSVRALQSCPRNPEIS